MFAQDLVPLSSSTRLKISLVVPVNTLSNVLNILSPGGKIRVPSTAEVLEIVTEFWHHIFDPKKATPAAEEPRVLSLR